MKPNQEAYYYILKEYLSNNNLDGINFYKNKLENLRETNQITITEISDIIAILVEESLSFSSKLRLIKHMTWLNFFEGQPKFFEFTIKSGILFEAEDVSHVTSIANLMIQTKGQASTRHYLLECLSEASQDYWGQILMAFYPTGHTIETLQVISKHLGSLNSVNKPLYHILYQHSLGFLSDSDTLESTNRTEDKKFLFGFIKQGMAFAEFKSTFEDILGRIREIQ